MKVIFAAGNEFELLQLERHESTQPNIEDWYILRSITDKGVMNAKIKKTSLEELRDAIDLELGPKE